MRIKWWILLFCLAFGLVFFTSANAEESMIEQKIFDELGDVHEDPTGSSPSMPGIDILSVEVSEEADPARVKLSLAGPYKGDAVYQIRLRIDNSVDATLTLEGEDNFTGSDSRIGAWEVSGWSSFDDHIIIWGVPYEVLDVSYGLVVVSATTELLGEGTTRYWDSCDWDMNDMEKGRIDIHATYKLDGLETIQRSIEQWYGGEAAAGFRYNLDTNSDRTVTQREIDEYLRLLQGVGSDAQWTDMTLKFLPATSVNLTVSSNIKPGPLNSIYPNYVLTSLVMTFRKPTEDPYEYRWNMELRGLVVPFWRATNDSFFKITPPILPGRVATFGKDNLGPVEESFYPANVSMFYMTGALMREHWNSTMLSSKGFTIVLKSGPPDENDGDECGSIIGIIAVPITLVMFTGYRGGVRRTRP